MNIDLGDPSFDPQKLYDSFLRFRLFNPADLRRHGLVCVYYFVSENEISVGDEHNPLFVGKIIVDLWRSLGIVNEFGS